MATYNEYSLVALLREYVAVSNELIREQAVAQTRGDEAVAKPVIPWWLQKLNEATKRSAEYLREGERMRRIIAGEDLESGAAVTVRFYQDDAEKYGRARLAAPMDVVYAVVAEAALKGEDVKLIERHRDQYLDNIHPK